VQTLTLGDLSKYLSEQGLANEIRGDSGRVITGCNTLDDACDGDITFLNNPKYREKIATTQASAIIMQHDDSLQPVIPQIICPDPYQALTISIQKIYGERRHPQWGLNEKAWIAPSATVGENSNIAPFAYIGANVKIGKNATIYPGTFVGPRAIIGDDVTLYANVTVYDDCKLGNRVTLHSGTVIGQDGLGYAPAGETWMKIPQVGNVEVGDDVEMGANCAIDRATMGTTLVGRGSKLSDLIAIGHGCKIGDNCMIVAQAGLAGTVTVGKNVIIAGQAGIVGHISIGDKAKVYAQSGVGSSVKDGESVLGTPATEVRDARRQMIAMQKLPAMRIRLREMETELAQLRAIVGELTGAAGDSSKRSAGESRS
jgi:UDP-3-O-[3-hydroxymyristoyl] glucosamine N-acyltransferase